MKTVPLSMGNCIYLINMNKLTPNHFSSCDKKYMQLLSHQEMTGLLYLVNGGQLSMS